MKPKASFTLIELLVVVAIIAVLVAVLLPALSRARLHARSAACLMNSRSISQAIVIYAGGNRDVLPLVTESPWINCVRGPRTTPLILRDERILPIVNERGGVWRCPLDFRDYKPHFLAYYYYYEGGPGNPAEAPLEGFAGSYSGNVVFRQWTSRCPFSGWDFEGGTFRAQPMSAAASPATTIMFYDSCWSWDAEADSPYQLFYTWATVEYYAGVTVPYYQLWRHNPDAFGPSGNPGFLDGHAQSGVDYLSTCCDRDYHQDISMSLRWWSLTGQ